MPLRLLFPLDGSERSFRALERALGMFRGAPGLDLTLLNVMQEGFEGAPEHVVEQYDADEEDEIFPTEASSKRMLAKAQEMCRQAGCAAHERVVRGKVYDEVLKESARHDVLVMHALDRSQIKETLRGSQTEKIARNAKCSVLVVQGT